VDVLAPTDIPEMTSAMTSRPRPGFEPRQLAGYLYFRVRPQRLQAWREVAELKDRDLMHGGHWIVRDA